MKTEKLRLDQLLVKKGLVESREKAKLLILAGDVLVDGPRRFQTIKPGQLVPTDTPIRLKVPLKYVGRGGLKLEKALIEFPITVAGKVAIDIGASTGGFTDCLLQNGADFVYAVDVGYGQMAWSLRQNTHRVKVIERTNIRHLDPVLIERSLSLAVIDVSFISLTKVFPSAINLLLPTAQIIALIKPQFEAGKRLISKGGVVRESSVHLVVIKKIQGAVEQLGWQMVALTHSPLRGPAGNIEFLALFTLGHTKQSLQLPIVDIVDQAHQQFFTQPI